MKKIFGLMMAMAIVFGLSMPAHATLILRGTDTLGNRLIYDDDLNITWYDYTKSPDPWPNQVNWADALSVTFGSTVYNDWRLPSTVDGPYSWGYDGTTTADYNITTSEMGHLFYTELGNLGFYDTSGNYQSGWGLTNTGPFQNLRADPYWSTVWSESVYYSWVFNFFYGYQLMYNTGPFYGNNYYALAVLPGDVSAVPEPGTLLLLGSGLAGLGLLARRLRRS